MTEVRPLRPRRVFIGWVLAAYALARVVSTTILLLVLPHQVPSSMTGGDGVPVTYFSFTALWDGEWYGRIAEDGYPEVLPVSDSGRVGQNPWAFYPLFPLLSRLLMAVTGLGFPTVASTIALLCGVGAAVLMGLLLRERIGDPAAYLVVALWASFPASVTLQLAYTESLAMLLLVGYLHALSRERWLVATAVALLIGLSRPIAVPLGLVTLVVVVMRWRRRRERPISTGTYASMLASLVGCGVAGLLWPAIAWWRTGSSSAYTDTMAAWRSYDTVELFVPWIDRVHDPTWGPWLVGGPIVILLMVAGPWARNLGADLRTWTLGYTFYLIATLDPFTSIFRYLIPLFPLLVVVLGAGWADRRGNTWRRLLWRFVPLLLVFVGGQYWWTDELWRYVPSPTGDYPP
ncbi:hypothetical protein [Terrabacter terrigena]|uniref:Glycosyltransferase RgtA/B/C/D-like domain-containing protein n=1 Tax=Terrabacter terrigena TaxID=574718 RepID=A0ABW3MSY7_9MICO